MSLCIDLRGRAMIVVGGARGIGAAVVRKGAECGSNVAWTCSAVPARSDASEVLLAETRALGAESLYAKVDCTDESATESLVARIKERFGRIDHWCSALGTRAPFRCSS
jgi:NAD(P)-dependent dehydrogenase (short-subunit alcohol dehydrogenase family)